MRYSAERLARPSRPSEGGRASLCRGLKDPEAWGELPPLRGWRRSRIRRDQLGYTPGHFRLQGWPVPSYFGQPFAWTGVCELYPGMGPALTEVIRTARRNDNVSGHRASWRGPKHVRSRKVWPEVLFRPQQEIAHVRGGVLRAFGDARRRSGAADKDRPVRCAEVTNSADHGLTRARCASL